MNKKRTVLWLGIVVILTFSAFVIFEFFYINMAHNSFENYYNFRGCVQLLVKDDTYATCKISSGKTIKIVKYQDKWYLDGDLPNGWFW